jgi:branched-chain amino acid transport system ATP-binding protein
LKTNIFQALAYFGPAAREEEVLRAEIERDVIDFLEINHIRHAPVAALSYGLQKLVELARALAMRPRILLLDEASRGMNREETEDRARFILDVKEEWGITILMVEHDMGMVMDMSDHVVVLNFGQLIAQGLPNEARANPEVVAAYLGSGDPASLMRRIGGERGMSMEMLFFLDLTLAGLGSGALPSLAALAFVMIYKATRIINLAVSELLTIGA